MNVEDVRDLCMSMHADVTEDIPFDKFGYGDVAFRIVEKIFAYLLLDGQHIVVLKCDPDKALELRANYPDVIEPAWHWNKKYWNQIRYDSPLITPTLLREFIEHSYAEVLKKLPVSRRPK